MTRSSLLGCAFLLACACPAVAREIAGADQALARFKAESARPAAPENGPEAIKRQFQEHLAQLTATVATLPPQEAATRWLTLVDEWRPLIAAWPHDQTLAFRNLLAALPGPEAWDALAAAVADRKSTGGPASPAFLRMLIAALRGDVTASQSSYAAWRKEAPETHDSDGDLEKLFATLSGTSPSASAVYEAQLTALEQGGDEYSLSEVPDLVTELGAAKAEAILKRVLTRSDVALGEIAGVETRRLALKIALGLKDRLAAPQWGLIQDTTPESMALYATLDRKFPRKGNNRQGSYERAVADGYHLRHLILTGKTAEAVRLAELVTKDEYSDPQVAFPLSEDEDLTKNGEGKAITAFLSTLLEQHPALPYWTNLVEYSARFGPEAKPGQAREPSVTLLGKIFARTDLAAATHDEIGEALLNAHLAADQPEDAVRVLRVLLAERLATPPKLNSTTRNPAALACQLLELGRLLKNDEWIRQGIADGCTAFQNGLSTGSNLDTYTALLFTLNQPAEAEDLLVSHWIGESRTETSYYAGSISPIATLASYYHRLGRHADVVKLMEEGTGWGATDLGFLGYEARFKLTAAQSLAALGRKDEARRILLAYLPVRAGDDAAYELLLSLGGDDVIPLLDSLYARNRFEERPLIWKAKRLLDDGRLDDAEKTIRAAIAVDPSDGEQGKGDRLRAYAVFADVMEKKGDAAQAATLRTAVSAIRLSEDADDFRYAGLTRRAIAMYERSLGLFADAYCIQSRLALVAEAAGDLAKAEEHYQRAYELMPDSFGEVESHCFGCEGIFSEPRAQGIAERIFTRLAAQPGAKAQVFYLLGYLRDAQERPKEALEQYRRAVQIDPDYFNAWEKILTGKSKNGAPHAVSQEAALHLMRLSPSSARYHLNEITDFRAAWPLLVAAVKAQPPAPVPLFEFKADKARLASLPGMARRLDILSGGAGSYGERVATPGGMLTLHPLFRDLANEASH
ncbi:tetratricopeptide repeat protein [Luteolibacter sp. LG18]|uniref:tetratricopeptide repeat protein n=1 Tax=Luteolibacter sp. LG18 TaxID=2819286 RepID=UPI002B319DAD|nr:hypothetical protein llg_26130 [Luteolibacter sp. LG18]